MPDDSAPADGIAIIVTDPASVVCQWNRAAARPYGWSRHEVLGLPITELTVGPDDADVADRIMASIRNTGS